MSKRRLLLNENQLDINESSLPIETQSNTVKFDNDGGYIHGNAGALTGNIVYDFTDEILGATAFMLHNASSAPTFPTETRIIRGSYVLNANNYIWFCLTKTASSRIVQVTIGQI
jgi:hypothetical protein